MWVGESLDISPSRSIAEYLNHIMNTIFCISAFAIVQPLTIMPQIIHIRMKNWELQCVE